jgi:hypothetical protein
VIGVERGDDDLADIALGNGVVGSPHRHECLVEIVGLTDVERHDCEADGLNCVRRSFVAPRHAEVVLVPQHRDAAQFRIQLFELRQSLGGKFGRVVRYATDVAAGRG